LNDELEWIWNEVVADKSRFHPRMFLEGLMKTIPHPIRELAQIYSSAIIVPSVV
jgi:hypothetical protein